MVSIQKLSIAFSDRYLFDEVTFLINQKDRIGLVGKNGAGKSTMLRFIAGKQSADTGEVTKGKETTIGYLAQEMKHNESAIIREEVKSALGEFKEIQNQITKLNEELATRTDYESEGYNKIIHDLSDLNERFSLIGGYQIDEKIERVLSGLGFENKEFDKPMSDFSGGWKMRVELAKILVQQPDLMLLDEPTNHLDIESIQWLEDFLKNYQGAILLISHDKQFLDQVTNRTLEINNGRVYDYKAPYSKYLKIREEELIKQEQDFKQQQKEIANTEQLIEKFRYKKNKAAFAQSLIKKLDKMDRIELDELDSSKMNFSFAEAPRSGKVVLEVEEIKKSFDEKEVLKGIDLLIGREEKIALVGKNGAGKSTLLKVLMGELKAGQEIEFGHNVKVGYFAQDQAKTLDPDITVFETIDNLAEGEMRKRVRNILGSFLFKGEDIDKKVKVLSGGERGRLALCKLLLQPYNFLILDEPTNHLDIKSKEVLKEALKNYDGTLLVVSHDRDFLADLTQFVYEVDRGKLNIHHGDINYFLNKRKEESIKAYQNQIEEKQKVTEANKMSSGKELHLEQKERKRLQNKMNKLEKEIQRLEEEVDEYEQKMSQLDYTDAENTEKELKKYEDLKKTLELTMEEWETIAFQLDE